MSSIISCVLQFCRNGANSANAINITLPKNSSWPFSHLHLDTSSNYFLISKFCTDGRNSSKKDNVANSNDKINSSSQSTTDGSNKDSPEVIPQDTFFTNDPAFGNKDNKGLAAGSRPYFNPEDSEENIIVDYELQPPTNCCMSGCPNCVWLDYVEKLTNIYANPELSRDKILKELDTMEDQNIKAFIMMELRTRKLI